MDKETLIKALGRIEGNPTIVVHSDRIRADFDITGHEEDAGLFVLFIRDSIDDADNSMHI